MALMLSKMQQIVDSKPSRLLSANMKSIVNKAKNMFGDSYNSPLLAIDIDVIKYKLAEFVDAMPHVTPHYAVKANPHPLILKALAKCSASFEVASVKEIEVLDQNGLLTRDIQFSNPVKSESSILYAKKRGIKWFAFDSEDELRKINNLHKDAKLSLRVDVPNDGSDWPLNGKFGVKLCEIDNLIKVARESNANFCGLTFHVGSQCRNPVNWDTAIQQMIAIISKMQKSGLAVKILNIGGGFPVELSTPVPSIKEIGEIIYSALSSLPNGVRVIAEPGRFLVAESGCLMSQVIGTAFRDGAPWVYLDLGMFGGLLELSQGLPYEMFSPAEGDLIPYTVAGPTCDAIDVLPTRHFLPQHLEVGDFVFILNAGAYTNVYASEFNGFPLPQVEFL